jgi:hypothetical protein
MFQFAEFAFYTYVFSIKYRSMTCGGLPHSEISGLKPVCDSPEHIAAYRVLHSLSLPSHPSLALSSLTNIFKNCTTAPILYLT